MIRNTLLRKELKRWCGILIKKYKPEKMILFGSLTNGHIHKWSDIDLIIIKNDVSDSFLKRIGDVMRLIDPKVGCDILVYTPKEFKHMCRTRTFFKQEIIPKCKVLYERGS